MICKSTLININVNVLTKVETMQRHSPSGVVLNHVKPFLAQLAPNHVVPTLEH